jgi:hypothetical protein
VPSFEHNGRASSGRKTRHVNIRYFFETDRVKKNELRIEYCPTGDMWGDFFTKPLQGSAFKRQGKAGKDYYGYMKNLLQYDYDQFVDAQLHPEQNSVFLHKGLFHDTVFPSGGVAYAHLDGDSYDSTFEMLQRIVPFMSKGGILNLDDVHHFLRERRMKSISKCRRSGLAAQ